MQDIDIKTPILNTIILLISFTDIEATLKIVLLVSSIIYTFMKIVETIKNKRNGIKTD